jgi:hypothetical protein
MLAFAIDHPVPATIMLITGDRDYAYAVSTLKLRKYQVVLVVPSPQASLCLQSQASVVIDWGAAVLRTRTEAENSVQAVRQPYPNLDTNLVAKLLRVLQEPPLDDSDVTLHPNSTASQSAPSLRRTGARDLLEPLGHSRNTGSIDSTNRFTHTPASSRRSTSAGSDRSPRGLPVLKTPSRSRHASISTGSPPACSTVIVAQSPPVVEQDIPAKRSPPSSARQPCISDITGIVNPAKRSLSVVPSLDALESPFRDNGPPSSIIIRSPLGPGQSTGDTPVSGNTGVPFFHKFNSLASPFVMPKAPTGLESIPNPSTKQPHTPTKPTSLKTKILTETVTSVCQTPQIKDIGVPKGIKRLTGPRIEGDDANSEWFIPHQVHSKEGTCDATYTPKSKNHSYVAPHTIYSPSSRNVGLHLVDTPSSEYVSPPAAIPLGVGDGVDLAPFAGFSRASDTLERSTTPGSESELSSSGFLSTPFTTSGSHEHDESERRQTWKLFKPLIHLLLAARERGITHPLRSTVASDLVQSDSQVYQRAGVSNPKKKFRNYAAMAEKAGIIELGGDWIALHPNWFGVDDITSIHSFSNRVPSPTSDPPKAIQSPLLTGSETPQIERTTLSQTPTYTSPKPKSPESSNTLPTLPSDRQDGVSRAAIPPQFQPLIDILIWMRARGSYPTLKSVVKGLLGKDVYARAGVSKFRKYVRKASQAQLVQFGGDGDQEWIRLHPELQI